jgi:hypothetical protein
MLVEVSHACAFSNWNPLLPCRSATIVSLLQSEFGRTFRQHSSPLAGAAAGSLAATAIAEKRTLMKIWRFIFLVMTDNDSGASIVVWSGILVGRDRG